MKTLIADFGKEMFMNGRGKHTEKQNNRNERISYIVQWAISGRFGRGWLPNEC